MKNDELIKLKKPIKCLINQSKSNNKIWNQKMESDELIKHLNYSNIINHNKINNKMETVIFVNVTAQH